MAKLEIGKMVSNPWILGGGALVGILLLTMGRGGSSGGQSVNPNAVLSANVEHNRLASQAVVERESIAAGKAVALSEINAGYFAHIWDSYVNLAGVDASRRVQMAEINAGITNHIVTSGTAVILDMQQNASRLMQGEQSIRLADVEGKWTHKVAKEQRKAAESTAEANMWGSIIGGAAYGVGSASRAFI